MTFAPSNLKAYSGYYNDTQTLLQSSSGGAASILSAIILNGGGAVFGACYSPDCREAEFACVEREEDLCRLKGSKYIPTQKRVLLNGEYVSLWPLVAEKLNAGREVLFTGLGCDVGALRSYLKANSVDASRLFAIDLVCFGPAILEIHRQYVEQLEAKYHSRLKSFTVRHKAKGWTPPYVRAEFENGQVFTTPFYESDYGQAFSVYTREQCYKCRFKGAGHQADITLGDYWGLTPEMQGWNTNGVSILIVKTPKGEELIKRIDKASFTIEATDTSFAIEHNPMYYESRDKPQDYAKFCNDLKTSGLHRAIVNHHGVVKYHVMRVKKYVKKIIPAPVKRILKAILRRG